MKKLQKIDDNDQEIGYLDHRKIEQESNWITGEIMSVGENVGTNQFQQMMLYKLISVIRTIHGNMCMCNVCDLKFDNKRV